MKVYEELSLRDFQTWMGATETKNKIIEECKEQEFEDLINELYPDGLSATQLNDELWFNSEDILNCLEIKLEDDESKSNINVI